jgi:hypothetical protein
MPNLELSYTRPGVRLGRWREVGLTAVHNFLAIEANSAAPLRGELNGVLRKVLRLTYRQQLGFEGRKWQEGGLATGRVQRRRA